VRAGRGGDGIVWRLVVREVRDEAVRAVDADAAGDDRLPFSASFEVPVFGR
jgi:hypothetical protein